MENVLKGKHFADVEKVKQNAAEAMKGIQMNGFKNFWAGRKSFWVGLYMKE